MKIALILGTFKTPVKNYYEFLQEYLKAFINKSYVIDLFTNDTEILSGFNGAENTNINNYQENLKTLIENNYDVIHNFGDENFALLSPYICRKKTINTLSNCPLNKEILEILPKTINISTLKIEFEQNKVYFNSFINLDLSESKAEIKDIIKEYENLYQNISKFPKVSQFTRKLNIVMYARGCSQFNGDTPYIRALGGTESSIVYISRELAMAGHNVTVFSESIISKDYDGVFYDFPENYDEYCKVNNIDVLIVSRDYALKNKLKGKISIFWAHEDFNQNFTINFFKNTFNGSILDKIFVISKFQKSNFKKHFKLPEDKLYLTRNGINPSFFINNKKRKKFKLMYTSTPHRGLEFLATIFPKIKEKVPEAYMEIYSSIKLYGYTEEFDNEYFGDIYRLLNNTEGITMKDLVSQPQLADAFSESYLLIYPNIYPETFCISALESQAAGTPVVTSVRGALTETIENGKTGICIPGDPRSSGYQEQFIKEVVDLLNDSEKWQKFSEQGRKRALADYSWEMIAGEWVETFNNLIIQYENLKDFFDFIQKITSEFVLYTGEKTIFYKLVEIMTENIEFTSLNSQQKDILSYFLNQPDIPGNIKVKIMIAIRTIARTFL